MDHIIEFTVPLKEKDSLISAFQERFPEGSTKIISVSDNKWIIMEGRVPIERKDEVIPFFHEFCGRFGLKYVIDDFGKITEVDPTLGRPKGDYEAV